MCVCKLCERHRRYRSIIARRDVDELIELVYEIGETPEAVELDVEVYEAIFEGAWTNSRQRLEKALAKIPPGQDQLDYWTSAIS